MKLARRFAKTLLLAAAMIAVLAAPLCAQDADVSGAKKINSCNDDPSFHELDFWLGSWDVKLGERVVGTSRIEKMLKGCAIVENWTATDGSEGKSLFYYNNANKTWRQVWVTDAAYAPGGFSEKTLVARMNGGGLRFQGEVTNENGEHHLERTSLVPRLDGTVRQWIQISTDGGQMWTSVFDAMYYRKNQAAR
jgi:hypothetical protein